MNHMEGNSEPRGEFDVPLRDFCLPQNGDLMFPVGVLRVDGSRGGQMGGSAEAARSERSPNL